MIDLLKETLWRQFGASIDMLENAIQMCPTELWDTEKLFWYNAYHCIFYLDYYLTLEPKSFVPPEPYTLSEFDPSGAMPDRTYSKEELTAYFSYGRGKFQSLIDNLTEETLNSRWVNEYKDFSVLETLLYNMDRLE